MSRLGWIFILIAPLLAACGDISQARPPHAGKGRFAYYDSFCANFFDNDPRGNYFWTDASPVNTSLTSPAPKSVAARQALEACWACANNAPSLMSDRYGVCENDPQGIPFLAWYSIKTNRPLDEGAAAFAYFTDPIQELSAGVVENGPILSGSWVQ